jgi:hypothetical protein
MIKNRSKCSTLKVKNDKKAVFQDNVIHKDVVIAELPFPKFTGFPEISSVRF